MGPEGPCLLHTFVLVTATAPAPAAERAVAQRNGAEESWGPAQLPEEIQSRDWEL